LSLLPSIYSLMVLLGRANFVRRGLIRQLCSDSIEQRLQDRSAWPIGLRTARAEAAAIRPALAQLRRDCPDLPPIPIHVLTAGAVKTKSAQLARDAWKAAVARAGATARYTEIANSGHYLPFDAPDAVVDGIVGVLDAVAPH
jgi:hypothetical protein